MPSIRFYSDLQELNDSLPELNLYQQQTLGNLLATFLEELRASSDAKELDCSVARLLDECSADLEAEDALTIRAFLGEASAALYAYLRSLSTESEAFPKLYFIR